MGAKTNEFISQISTLSEACKAPLSTVVEAAAKFKVQKEAYDKLAAQSAARVEALTGNMQWSAGKAPAKVADQARGLSSEDFVSADALFKKLDHDMGMAQSKMGAEMSNVHEAKKALQLHLKPLNLKITEFQGYITKKKAATLNPFKKKSVTQAETVITTARTFATSCLRAIES